METKLKWEKIDQSTERASIHGGWLVKHREMIGISSSPLTAGLIGQKPQTFRISTMMCFVPDVTHSWVLNESENKGQ